MDAVAAGISSPRRPEIQRKKRLHKRRRFEVYVAAGILVIAGCGLAVAFRGPLSHQIDLSVKRQPAPYASLYFTSPGTLPSDLLPNTKYPVSFTVANHDTDAKSFRYVVTLTSPGFHSETEVGLVPVPGSAAADQTVEVTPAGPCSPCKVVIALPSEKAMIYFNAGSPT